MNKKVLLISGSVLTLLFSYLYTKDSELLNSANLTINTVSTANADAVVVQDPPPGDGADGDGSDGCGCDGGCCGG